MSSVILNTTLLSNYLLPTRFNKHFIYLYIIFHIKLKELIQNYQVVSLFFFPVIGVFHISIHSLFAYCAQLRYKTKLFCENVNLKKKRFLSETAVFVKFLRNFDKDSPFGNE